MIFSGLSIYIVALVLLACTVLLIYIHFLHSMRRQVTVPGLYFWNQVSGGQNFNKISGRLHNLRTFLFLLLIIFIFCVVLLRPVINDELRKEYVLVFDCRTAMGTISEENGTSHLEQAKKTCYELLDKIKQYKQITLISFSDTVNIYTETSGNINIVKRNIDLLTVNESSNQISYEYALDTAKSLVNSQPEIQVYVFSDRGFELNGKDENMSNFHLLNPSVIGFNLAIIDMQILPHSAVNADTAMLTIGCFGSGDDDTAFSIILYNGKEEISAMQSKMSPGTFQTIKYKIPTGLESPIFCLLCDDMYAGDNISEEKFSQIHYYSEIELPVPLKLYLDSDPRYELVDSKKEAELIISDAFEDDCKIDHIVIIPYEASESYNRTIPASNLIDAVSKFEFKNMFVKTANGFTIEEHQFTPFIYHEEGRCLAACSRSNGTEKLYLSGALFDADSNFWKQMSYIKVMNQMMQGSFRVSNGNSSWNSYSDIYAASDMNGSNIYSSIEYIKPEARELFIMLTMVVIVLLVLESILYQKGVIE